MRKKRKKGEVESLRDAGICYRPAKTETTKVAAAVAAVVVVKVVKVAKRRTIRSWTI